MKQIKPILMLCLLSVCTFYNKTEGAANMLQNKPFLTVHLNTSSCTHEARINDVILLPDNGRNIGSDVATIPVNHWVHSGENELSVKIFPMPKEDTITNAQIEIAFQVKPFGDKNLDKKFTLATLKYQGSSADEEELKVLKSSVSGTFDSKNELKKNENGDITVGDIVITKIKEEDIEGIRISRTITLPLPFPEWNWFSSDLIEDNEATKQDLWKVYLKIFDDIKSKKFDSIYKMFDEYKEEHAIAMYNPSLNNDPTYIAEDANNPDYELFEILPEYSKHLKMLIFGNKKLAKLVFVHNNFSPIGFDMKGGGSSNHTFIFRKKGDKWILCR